MPLGYRRHHRPGGSLAGESEVIPVIVSLVTTAIWIGYSIWSRNHPPATPETHMTLTTVLGYVALAVLGYLARHYHLNIPFLPQSPNVGPTPAPVDPTKPAPVVPDQPPPPLDPTLATGRPILDLMLSAALAEVTNPLARAAIIAEAQAIKKMLDAANVPSVGSTPAPNK